MYRCTYRRKETKKKKERKEEEEEEEEITPARIKQVHGNKLRVNQVASVLKIIPEQRANSGNDGNFKSR